MFFQRIYDERLAQASYLIGCQASGTAVVVDPARDIAPYLGVARAEGFTISAVTETHIHADFVSGLRELVAATGAHGYLSGCGPAEWQYGFRGDPGMVLLADGDSISVGNVRLTAVYTPGHTPEHLSFLVTDGAATDAPIGILTGDFVFVGDVGRPDLLEKAAHLANTAEAGARQLWKSLRWFETLPDHLQVWPGHGAGSACGKGLGAMPQTTVGYERRVSWAFSADGESAFVKQVLAGQPEPPAYFGRMKQVNRDGPPILGNPPSTAELAADRLDQALAKGIVADVRATADFAAGHIPGTVNIPMGKSFPTYAGSLLPYDRDLYFVVPDVTGEAIAALERSLRSIGLDRLAGVFSTAVLETWTGRGKPFGTVRQITIDEFKRTKPAVVIDVRNTSEWEGGHLAKAKLIPLPELMARLAEIPRDAEVVVHCQGGGRSAVAASVLQRAGHERVSNLVGGFSAWVAAGGSVET